ncbi:MAG: hypothetical protein ACKPKO_28490, partial [Candidatus Fonsibacter sp.]
MRKHIGGLTCSETDSYGSVLRGLATDLSILTAHASDMLDPRNAVPYYELPVYTTTWFQYLPCRPLGGKRMTMGVFSDPQANTLYSSSIKFTCIPDNIIVCVRKHIGGLTCSETDSYGSVLRGLATDLSILT